MNILVTGGAGFIGSHLIDRLLAEGHSVTNLDSFSNFYDRSIKENNIRGHQKYDTYRLIEGDIREAAPWEQLEHENFDQIVHLAAKAGVRPSILDPKAYQRTNVLGTQNLMHYAQEKGIKHIVYASSSSVYGISPEVPWKEDDTVLRPISIYAATKITGEQIGRVYAHLYGIRFVALRFFTVFGPRQRPDLAIHKFTRAILNGDPITMYGDGSTERDYTYIDDIVSGIQGAMNYTGSTFEVFNLGNNRTVALRDLIAAIERATGKPANIVQHPEQPGDVPRTCADVEKSGRLLHYRPQTDLDTGLQKFVAWYSEVMV